ncbi:MAG: glycoside hydrolase family 3 protein [Lentisphaerae bacterium]|nr:glycoside hydrolase family 3 protein [Lentisphaerota bacterium]
MGNWADRILRELTLEQKVGQVICYRASRWRDETLALARRGLVGCVSPGYYRGMGSLEAILEFINDLNAASAVPVFCISSSAHARPEFGPTPLPDPGSTMLFGAARDPDLAYRYARCAARESKAMGYDMVWEPCVDVNTEPRNPIIGSRSISDRPELVASIAAAMVRGMQDERVVPNAKHFPGHGDTAFDTHVRIGEVGHPRERLDAVELYPYRELIRSAGLRGIMTAHLVVPALEPDRSLPATFSRRAIHDLLRLEMGFTGLIVSDSLTMKAIKDNFGVAEAAIRAFEAGHDIVLQDYNEPPEPTLEALVQAVSSGRIPMADLDASVRRILEAKEWCGLPGRAPLEPARVRAAFRQPEAMAVAEEAFAAAVTLLEGAGLPLDCSGGVAVIATVSPEEGRALTDMEQTIESAQGMLAGEVRRRLGPVTLHHLPEDPTPDEVAAAVAAAGACRRVILATMPRIVCYKALSGAVGPGQPELVRRLQAAGKDVALCVFGTPYVIPDFPRTDICLTTYCASPGAVRAGLRVLFGEQAPRGRLPVDLRPRYAFGFGLESEA